MLIPASTVGGASIQPPYDVWLDYNLPGNTITEHGLYVTCGNTFTGAIGAMAIGEKL
jgi:hypothetical protein